MVEKNSHDEQLPDTEADGEREVRVEPPAGMKERVINHAFTPPSGNRGQQPVAPAAPKTWTGRRVSRWMLTAAAALILGAASVTTYQNTLLRDKIREESRTGVVGNVVQSIPLKGEQQDGKAYILRKGDQRRLILSSDSLPDVKGKKVYQVWLLKGKEVQSAGTFVPAEDGESLFAAQLSGDAAFDKVAITREPDAYGEAPRGAVVLAGRVTLQGKK